MERPRRRATEAAKRWSPLGETLSTPKRDELPALRAVRTATSHSATEAARRENRIRSLSEPSR